MPFAWKMILSTTALAILGGLVVALVVRGITRLAGAARPRFWRRLARAHVVLVPLYALLVPPVVLATIARFQIGTRGDEAAYAGPRIDDASGTWSFQDRASLRRERGDENAVPAAVRAAAAARQVTFTAADGVRLQGFLVASRCEPPRFQAVLVHGLFRNALELEPVAAMLHALGGEVLLLEQRNHGGSGRARPTFGLTESADVAAAVGVLRARRGDGAPLILFGVSLGTAAVAFAAPRVDGLDGLVLDAPFPALEDVARNLMQHGLGFPAPYRVLTLQLTGWFAGFDPEAVRPVDALARLPADLPALVIGAGDDFRTPPTAVRQVYQAIPAPDGVKELWIDPAATHGKVWEEAPEEYARRLAALVERALARHRP